MSSESRSVIEKLTLRILTSIRWRLLQPKPPGIVLHSQEILTLGSKYGKKSFIRPKSISETLVVISGGVGEDISFDVELANLYKCKIILVDPSSHAIGHIQEILKSLGQKAEQNYSDSSRQPISSYDLSIISKDDLQFRPLGLWSSTTKLDFYQPPDASRDASGSIGAIHSYYKPTGIPEQINVITIKDLMSDFKLTFIDILKLDIEGAALEVIQRMFSDQIYPHQILVEVDEMHFPSFKSKIRAHKLFQLLNDNEYTLIFIDSCDFLYVRNNLLL
jgi:FkbM family methyltransferase